MQNNKGFYCRPSGRLYSPACMRNSMQRKSHNFQRFSLFLILYNDFLKFLENRDKEFKLRPMYFNFPRELHHHLHVSYLNIRSGNEIEAATRELSQAPLKTFVKLAEDSNIFIQEANNRIEIARQNQLFKINLSRY